MYCSKGMLRLTETYHIDLPRSEAALNGWPAGFHDDWGASACWTSCCAWDTFAFAELLVPVLPLDPPQAAVSKHPETTRTFITPVDFIRDVLPSSGICPTSAETSLDVEPPTSRKARDRHRDDERRPVEDLLDPAGQAQQLQPDHAGHQEVDGDEVPQGLKRPGSSTLEPRKAAAKAGSR